MSNSNLLFMLLSFIDDNNLESKFIDYCIESGESQEEIEDAIDEFKNQNT